MIYKVKAKIIEDTIGKFYRKLADGTVAKQRPDGEEITASMKRAVLTAPGWLSGMRSVSAQRPCIMNDRRNTTFTLPI